MGALVRHRPPRSHHARSSALREAELRAHCLQVTLERNPILSLQHEGTAHPRRRRPRVLLELHIKAHHTCCRLRRGRCLGAQHERSSSGVRGVEPHLLVPQRISPPLACIKSGDYALRERSAQPRFIEPGEEDDPLPLSLLTIRIKDEIGWSWVHVRRRGAERGVWVCHQLLANSREAMRAGGGQHGH